MKTIMYSRLVEAWTMSRDDIPLLENLTSTSVAYNAIVESIRKNRVSTFEMIGRVPINVIKCNPNCVWGDCIN
jgi:hypothetical protein